jgi:hypothetical protein
MARRWLRDTFAPALEEHLSVKPFIVSLIASTALASCAPPTAVGLGSALSTMTPRTVGQSNSPQVDESTGYASAAVGDDRYEITYSGPWLGSRDAIEGGLLYRAALLAKQHGKTWFRFLHMPGEAGPLSHPSRQAPSFGAAYGHWQPHWTYRTGTSWQPWHPEWGTPFWAENLAGRSVERVEAHAMIELGQGPFAASEQTDFDVSAILRDLRPDYE